MSQSVSRDSSSILISNKVRSEQIDNKTFLRIFSLCLPSFTVLLLLLLLSSPFSCLLCMLIRLRMFTISFPNNSNIFAVSVAYACVIFMYVNIFTVESQLCKPQFESIDLFISLFHSIPIHSNPIHFFSVCAQVLLVRWLIYLVILLSERACSASE